MSEVLRGRLGIYAFVTLIVVCAIAWLYFHYRVVHPTRALWNILGRYFQHSVYKKMNIVKIYETTWAR